MKDEGCLVRPAAPRGPQAMEYLVGQQLAIIRDEADEEDPLTFKSSWDTEKIDGWLRKLFPEVFKWLDIRYPLEKPDQYHWCILAKERQTLTVFKKIPNGPIDGKDLEKLKGPAAQRWNLYKLWFGKFSNNQLVD